MRTQDSSLKQIKRTDSDASIIVERRDITIVIYDLRKNNTTDEHGNATTL